jgi:predicted ATP-grasp superfamily ATP-dependent carboligase
VAKKLRILQAGGVGYSAVETVQALGFAGYEVGVCDPNPLCMGRSSKFVKAFHPVPNPNESPRAYLQAIARVLKAGRYDALVPVHEPGLLFARYREFFANLAPVALPTFEAYDQLLSKVNFYAILKELGLAFPATQVVRSIAELREATRGRSDAYFIKTEYGNAMAGIFQVERPEQAEAAIHALEERDACAHGALLIQAPLQGELEALQIVARQGEIVAAHGFRRFLEGSRGGSCVKISLWRPDLLPQVERIARHLQWHGSLHLEYFFDEASGRAFFLDANPRLVEPGNGVACGVNLASAQVAVSRSEPWTGSFHGRTDVRTHNVMSAVSIIGARGGSRWQAFARLAQVATHRSPFDGSESMLNPARDYRTAVSLGRHLPKILWNPQSAAAYSEKIVSSYSLAPATIAAFKREAAAGLDGANWALSDGSGAEPVPQSLAAHERTTHRARTAPDRERA